MSVNVYLEAGSKRVFACALDWPGWCRSAKTEEAALETLGSYVPRYAPVAAQAGFSLPPGAADDLRVVERLPGSATTDFGALDAPCQADLRQLTEIEAERLAALVEASWNTFDQVVAGAPAELRKGPRGGGRDRDKIVEHVLGAEAAYARKLGLRFRPPVPGDLRAISELRSTILEGLRTARAPLPGIEKAWPYRYAARRIAWHVLDHAWEIQDRSQPAP